MENQDKKGDYYRVRQCKFLQHFAFFLIPILFQSLSLQAQSDSLQIQENKPLQNRTEEYLRRLVDQTEKDVLNSKKGFEDIEIDEIIVNDMITKAGDDFFDLYSSDFEWPETDQNFIIIIAERPFIASSTLLTIKVNDLEVFRSILQPRGAYLEEIADYAQAVTMQYIINYEQIMNDLDGDDRSGTGIY